MYSSELYPLLCDDRGFNLIGDASALMIYRGI